MRPLTELTNTNDPAWPLVQAWIAEAPHVEVLAADEDEADAALLQLQATLRSPMGAVVHHTGGAACRAWLAARSGLRQPPPAQITAGLE
ncbi:DUF2625 family protein [Roseateles sp. BYS78W]|uniref:DUF2625 family protein n=1 Tax=Pelomonas candidula TaxID=3299025 RepID=A0ABW7HJV5_9BURK